MEPGATAASATPPTTSLRFEPRLGVPGARSAARTAAAEDSRAPPPGPTGRRPASRSPQGTAAAFAQSREGSSLLLLPRRAATWRTAAGRPARSRRRRSRSLGCSAGSPWRPGSSARRRPEPDSMTVSPHAATAPTTRVAIRLSSRRRVSAATGHGLRGCRPGAASAARGRLSCRRGRRRGSSPSRAPGRAAGSRGRAAPRSSRRWRPDLFQLSSRHLPPLQVRHPVAAHSWRRRPSRRAAAPRGPARRGGRIHRTNTS